MRRLLLCIITVLILLAPVQAFPWDNPGHMAVAYVAWQRLNDTAKSKVIDLVKQNPLIDTWNSLIPDTVTDQKQRDMYLFMIAATWPDQIKEMSSQYLCNGHFSNNKDAVPPGETASLNIGYDDLCIHKYWHFVDVSLGTPVHTTPTVNGDVKIELFTTAMSSNESALIKSYDLMWLEHLVGDLHQPLHCVTRYSVLHPKGDAGANEVSTKTPSGDLHAYWDDILGKKTANLFTDATLAEQIAKALPVLSASDVALAADNVSDHWVLESFTYAQSDAYVSPIGPEWGPYPLNLTYHDNAFKLAQKRITFAGIRLSNLLNAVFPAAA